LKAEERAEAATNGEREAIEDAYAAVPLAAPALTRAQDLLGRAQRAGDVATTRAGEARAGVESAAAGLTSTPSTQELGALLWVVVELARAAEVDAEEALRIASSAFVAQQRSRMGSEAGTPTPQ